MNRLACDHMLAVAAAICIIFGTSYGSTTSPTDATWVHVEVNAGAESGKMSWLMPPGAIIDGETAWDLPEAAVIRSDADPQKELATVDRLIAQYAADPVVSPLFAVTAGDADTVFTITSANLTFRAIPNPEAYATAGVTVTDADMDGATLTGMQAGGNVFEARYNGAVAWCDLGGGLLVSSGSTGIAVGRTPPQPTVTQTIPATVSSIQSEFKFKLSAHDQASGTSTFEVIPEPATLLLLAIGGLLFMRRRRVL